ncbi:MAG: NAD-dependent epimerase/dehydratase family protein [Psychrobium sp.]
MAHFTVVGGKGFIGSELVSFLKLKGHSVFVPQKHDDKIFSEELGIVVYCAGHGDCQNNPAKVVESNLTYLSNVVEKSHFEKLVYLSSTRVYMGIEDSEECSNLLVEYSDQRKLFNLTKLAAEELILRTSKNAAIIRPSNVYGLALNSPLFLPSITRDAILKGEVNMYVSPEYEKDYVSVVDVVTAIEKISLMDITDKVINIASGVNVSAGEIAAILQSNTGCKVNWHKNTLDDYFPRTNIEIAKRKLHLKPAHVLDDLQRMIVAFKDSL